MEGHVDINQGWKALVGHGEAREEMQLIIELAFANSRRLTRPEAGLEQLPLALHGSYQREEILAALGHADRPGRSQFREECSRPLSTDGPSTLSSSP